MLKLNVIRHALACMAAASLTVATGASHAGYVDVVTNLEWRQLTETTGYAYNQINTGGINGCSAATGACAGQLEGTGPSLNGWTWATEAEVRTLFANFAGTADIAGFNSSPAVPTNYNIFDSIWAPAILDDDGTGPDQGLFYSSDINPGQWSRVAGLTRTLQDSQSVYAPSVTEYGTQFQLTLWDRAQTDEAVSTVATSSGTGIWMYRALGSQNNNPVPLPASIWLVGLGACLLGVGRRRDSPRQALRRAAIAK